MFLAHDGVDFHAVRLVVFIIMKVFSPTKKKSLGDFCGNSNFAFYVFSPTIASLD